MAQFSMDAKTGAFQQLPMVSPAYEILGSALRKARMVRPTKGFSVLLSVQNLMCLSKDTLYRG